MIFTITIVQNNINRILFSSIFTFLFLVLFKAFFKLSNFRFNFRSFGFFHVLKLKVFLNFFTLNLNYKIIDGKIPLTFVIDFLVRWLLSMISSYRQNNNPNPSFTFVKT
jgi:hypothetical protein